MSRRLSPGAQLAWLDVPTAPHPALTGSRVLAWIGDPAAPPEAPLGAQAEALLRVHARLVGPTLELVANCPACGCAHDIDIDIENLLEATTPPADPTHGTVELSGVTHRLRPPTPADLAQVGHGRTHDVEQALLDRCLDTPLGRAPNADERAALDSAFEAIDPFCDLATTLACVSCEQTWIATLDPADLLAARLDVAATQVAAEVAELARAFHWSEDAILAMSPTRRSTYLALARS